MKKITLVGGGLVGSLLAYTLGKRGYDVSVLERRPDMRKTDIGGGRSINLVLSKRGFTSLEKAGIDTEIRKITVPAYGRMTHAVDGSQQFFPYSIDNQAIYSVSRGELNKKLMDLAETLPNVQYFFSQRCVDVDLTNGTGWFVDENNNTTEIKADLLIGSDGAFSAVRSKMMTSGRFNYSQEYIEHGYKEIHIPAADDGSAQLDINALHIWPRKQFMLMGLANLDNGFTGTLFFPYEGEESFDTIRTEAQVDAFFKKQFPDAIPLIPNLTEQYMTNPTSPLVIVRCGPWHYGDKTMIIGDAAHAIVPFYGEGMNAGFEDVKVFTDILDELGDANMGAVLRKYHDMRKPNGDAIADLSMRNFVEMRDLVSDPQFILRKKIEGHIQKRNPEKWIPLYSQVKFTNIQYIDAWNEGLRQDAIMEPILSRPGIEKNWDDTEVEQLILNSL
jgi:kynurenine 3-monooxygenase